MPTADVPAPGLRGPAPLSIPEAARRAVLAFDPSAPIARATSPPAAW